MLTSVVSADVYFYNEHGHYFTPKRMLTYLLSDVFPFYRYKKTAETSGELVRCFTQTSFVRPSGIKNGRDFGSGSVISCALVDEDLLTRPNRHFTTKGK